MNARPKILIVDDRAENLLALEVVLKDLDIELVKATSGNEALKATLRSDFALALLDIQMPDMDGFELADILREEERTAHLPFIFISAVYTDNMNVFKGYEKGAFSFITKPFQPEILINKVKFFIEKHQQALALLKLNNDLQNKNAELEFSNKELEAFSYSISHDLRAPLRAINGYAEVLKEDYQAKIDDDGKQLLADIVGGAVRMGNLIDSLLTFSRLGKQEVKKEEIDMNVLMKGILNELKPELQNKKIEFIIKDLPPVKGDVTLMKQVFINLLSNAIKYSAKKEHPVIEVSAERSGNENIYTVKDNGAGFDMKYREKLFGVFQRLHGADEFEGIGIGLAIVKRIVHRHGGHIKAEGEVDKGAVFHIGLPA